jgi:hypothetical protein
MTDHFNKQINFVDPSGIRIPVYGAGQWMRQDMLYNFERQVAFGGGAAFEATFSNAESGAKVAIVRCDSLSAAVAA